MAHTLEGNNSLVDLNKIGLGELKDIVPVGNPGSNPGTLAIDSGGKAGGESIKTSGGGVAGNAGQRGRWHGLGLDGRHDDLLQLFTMSEPPFR